MDVKWSNGEREYRGGRSGGKSKERDVRSEKGIRDDV